MIVYSFKEEFRIIILLLCYAISIGFTYDLLMNIINNKIRLIAQMLYSIIIIYISFQFVFKLKNGFIPQYALLILFFGLLIYWLLLKKNLFNSIRRLTPLFKMILKLLNIILIPFNMAKTTFSLYKLKKVKNNNQNTLQK